MNDYNKSTEELTDEEMWSIIEEITCNMSDDERDEWLEGLGE